MKAELLHDSLASRIFAKASAEEKALRKVQKFLDTRYEFFKKDGVLMEEEDLGYINPYLDQLEIDKPLEAFITKSRKAISGRRRLIIGGIVAGIVFLAFLVYALYLWRDAEAKSRTASEKAAIAQNVKDDVALQVVDIQTEKKRVTDLTAKILRETRRVDSLKNLAIVLADSARKAEAEATLDRRRAEEARIIAEEAEKRIQRIAQQSKSLFLLAEASDLLDKGDVRLAFLLTDEANQLYPDTLALQTFQAIAQSPIQNSINHASGISAAAFSSDGEYVVTGSEDGQIKLTNIQKSEEVKILQHEDAIRDLQFSPDDQWILSASADHTAILWDGNGNKQAVFIHEAAVNQARFTPSGNIVTASDDGTAKLWKQDGELLVTFEHTAKVISAIPNPEENAILTASHDHTAINWSMNGEKKGIFHHDGPLVSATYSPSGGYILTASLDSTAKLWRVSDQKLIMNVLHDDQMVAAQFHPSFRDDAVSLRHIEDADMDGVEDINDLEKFSIEGAPVGRRGKVLDTDGDGIIDLYDEEKDTPKGARVDEKGKALDTDGDGVIDFFDLEKDTPKGAKVSILGIAVDTDGDGIIDLKDEEIETPKGFPVDLSGVTLDEDQDGINDLLDWEPGTPEGAKVNVFGQALDTDRDGIIDLEDQENSTKTLARVNSVGETDKDGDGIKDGEDEEIQSPEGARIDKAGRSDNDGDGIPDVQDKEWYTPESAEINEYGEAKDTDQDGLPDIIDLQVQTPIEFIDQVDAFGRQPDYPGDLEMPEYIKAISYTSESGVGDPLYQILDGDTMFVDEAMSMVGEPLTYTVGSFITAYFLTASIDGNLTIWNAGELNENLTQRPQRLNIPASLMHTGFYFSGNRPICCYQSEKSTSAASNPDIERF